MLAAIPFPYPARTVEPSKRPVTELASPSSAQPRGGTVGLRGRNDAIPIWEHK